MDVGDLTGGRARLVSNHPNPPVPDMSDPDLALVFLARGADGGRDAAKAFFDSYRAHPAGCPHALVVLAKGWERVPGLDDIRQWTAALNGTVIDLPDDGFDLGAYFRAVGAIRQRHVCFLNTHSRILADRWLAHLYDAALQPGVGAAGAAGSWQSYFYTELDRWRRENLAYKARHLGRLIKAARRYPVQFPNVFLRTNAFVIARETFAAFAQANGIPQGRDHVGPLENGRVSLTAFLKERGLGVVVVGADGRTFQPADWPRSGTYIAPGQPNLLVSDNRTRFYDTADVETRRRLERLVWGLSPA